MSIGFRRGFSAEAIPYDFRAGSVSESRRERALRRIQQKRRRLSSTRNATPPTAPPAIAPVWLVVPAVFEIESPPDDDPPTPATLVEADAAAADEGADEEADEEAEGDVEVDEAEEVVLDEEVVAEAGDAELMQLVPPDCTVNKLVDPPVMAVPESLIIRRNSVPAAMSTGQSYERSPAFCEMGRENAEPAGIMPYRLTGYLTVLSQVMCMVSHDVGLVG